MIIKEFEKFTLVPNQNQAQAPASQQLGVIGMPTRNYRAV